MSCEIERALRNIYSREELNTIVPHKNYSELDDNIYYKAFIHACNIGDFKRARELWQLKPDIDGYNYERAFSLASFYGSISFAEWLIQIKPNLNISFEDEIPFTTAIYNRQIDFAKWLLEIKPDIDISARNNCSFLSLCYRGDIFLVLWFQSLRPFKYEITNIKPRWFIVSQNKFIYEN